MALSYALLCIALAPWAQAQGTERSWGNITRREVGLNLADSIAYARQQVLRTDDNVPKGLYPHGGECTSCKGWKAEPASRWVSGFLPGELFLLAGQGKAINNDTLRRTFLERGLARLTPELKNEAKLSTSHDVGFKVFLSYGYAYELTGEDEYRTTVLRGAQSLYKRYNHTIKAIKAWDPWRYKKEPIKSFHCPVIIDSMLNIEILFWAAEHGGEAKWRTAAINHAKTTIQQLIREDGCTWHTVDYNVTTGQPIRHTQLPQSYSPSSMWARGQAWAIMGFVKAYKYTKEPIFATTAANAAKCYLRHMKEWDLTTVPPFDFGYPKKDGFKPDTSAAAIVAAALVQLARITSNSNYTIEAKTIIEGLQAHQYYTKTRDRDPILLRGMGDYGKVNEDVALIYGDFYYVQALLDLSGQLMM